MIIPSTCASYKALPSTAFFFGCGWSLEDNDAADFVRYRRELKRRARRANTSHLGYPSPGKRTLL